MASRLQEVNEKYAERIIVQKQAEKVSKAVEERANAMSSVAEERIALNKQLAKVMQQQGLDLDLSGMTELERLNAVREELRKTAEFGKADTPFGDPKPLNESAKALQNLKLEGLALADALDEQRKAEENLVDVEEHRKKVLEQLGISAKKANEHLQENRSKFGGGKSGAKSGVTKQDFQSWEYGYLQVSKANDVLNKFLDNASQSDIIGTFMKEASRNVEQYNQALTEAHNELKSGAITQQEYERRVKSATETFRGNLERIYKMLKDKLTPEQEKFFKKLFNNFEDANEESEDMGDQLENIADMADSIINLADAFGAIGDNARRSLTGVSDLLRNASKLSNLESGAGFLKKAVPTIGIAWD
ncbi:hypothetical protein [Fodinibius sp.]|uniref:hypothetical protein n=1 Tax=Fodinibius sp. TaxID=1872440 RepID=UPI002ACEAAE4|nr:hypothetical protein [Fodinibius sp.]MDZ7658092.1 hypothetical protein [Fodinibius sp.]